MGDTNDCVSYDDSFDDGLCRVSRFTGRGRAPRMIAASGASMMGKSKFSTEVSMFDQVTRPTGVSRPGTAMGPSHARMVEKPKSVSLPRATTPKYAFDPTRRVWVPIASK